MSKITDLEKQLQELRYSEAETKRKQRQEALECFRELQGIDVYTSDDYCGLGVGDIHFYYGYEVEENEEWGFTVSKQKKEIFRLPKSKLWPEEGEEPYCYLLAGIGHYIKFLGQPKDDNH